MKGLFSLRRLLTCLAPQSLIELGLPEQNVLQPVTHTRNCVGNLYCPTARLHLILTLLRT